MPTGRSRTLTRRGFLAAGGALAMSAVVGASQTPVPVPTIPRMRVAVSRLPDAMDPATSISLEHLWIDTLCLDSPNRWNAAGDILMSIASRQSVPGNEEQFELVVRPGTMFFDGSPLRADDLRYTIERIRNAPGQDGHAWRVEHIRRIETVDPQTVRIELDRPDASLPASLSHQAFGVIRAGTNLPDIRGGTGPFSLRGRDDDRILYERNPHFWQIGRPRIETLQIQQIADDTRRTTAIATGEIDLLPNVPLLDIPMLLDEPTVYLVGGPSNRVCYLQMNLASGELVDARVRRLISSAIDRPRLVDVATAGQATPTGLLFPADSWAHGDIEDVVPLSPETIREELRALGIPPDLRLRLLTDNADATLANTAVVLQEQLASCGIALSVELLQDEELETAIRLREFDLLAGYAPPWRDPQELVRPLLASDGNRNRSGYVNEDVDILMRGAILHDDRAFRNELYTRIEQRVQADVPVIVLFHPHYYDAVTTNMAGYGMLPPVTSRGLLTVQPATAARAAAGA
jgi:peptide/nickel transport system substrate-binding protein